MTSAFSYTSTCCAANSLLISLSSLPPSHLFVVNPTNNQVGTNAPYTDCAGLPAVQPSDGWPPYYGEGLKAIEWARNQSTAAAAQAAAAAAAAAGSGGQVGGGGGGGVEWASSVDWAAGVGIAGHSMGGQAAAIIAGSGCPKAWDVRAAALHHPANGANGTTRTGGGGNNIGSAMSVPVAAFTSSGDGIWPETADIYGNATSLAGASPRAYRDATGFSHLEPLSIPPGFYNGWLAPLTAAWFKVFLGEAPGALDPGGAWRSVLFNASDPGSLCNHAPMTRCETVEQ